MISYSSQNHLCSGNQQDLLKALALHHQRIDLKKVVYWLISYQLIHHDIDSIKSKPIITTDVKNSYLKSKNLIFVLSNLNSL